MHTVNRHRRWTDRLTVSCQ